jgi:hypothetical protein
MHARSFSQISKVSKSTIMVRGVNSYYCTILLCFHCTSSCRCHRTSVQKSTKVIPFWNYKSHSNYLALLINSPLRNKKEVFKEFLSSLEQNFMHMRLIVLKQDPSMAHFFICHFWLLYSTIFFNRSEMYSII